MTRLLALLRIGAVALFVVALSACDSGSGGGSTDSGGGGSSGGDTGGGSGGGSGGGTEDSNSLGFSWHAPGDLLPATGEGVEDWEEYVVPMTFPVDSHETYLNSQVHSPGGGGYGGGSQCDAANYAYPWRDTFCELRSGTNRATRNCPSTEVHQGVDIRAGTPAICSAQSSTSNTTHNTIEVVATEDGYISYIGSYTVNLNAGGRIYRYMHLNMAMLDVALFDDVVAGDRIGFLSNHFGGTSTTLHLHFEIKENLDDAGFTYVSPYMSLVRAYEQKHSVIGDLVE